MSQSAFAPKRIYKSIELLISFLLDCRVRVNLSLMVSIHSYDEEKSVRLLFAVVES